MSLGDELTQDLARLTERQGEVGSQCTGWTVRDFVVHLSVGDDLAERSLRGENCFPSPTYDERSLQQDAFARVASVGQIDLAAAVAMFVERWRRLLDLIVGLPATAQGQPVEWVAKPLSRFALVQSRLMETWVHSWDLRQPLGLATAYDDRAWWVSDLGIRHVPTRSRNRASTCIGPWTCRSASTDPVAERGDVRSVPDPERPTTCGSSGRPGPG